MKQLLVLGMAVALAGAALAYPSLLGPTGGANLPVARTVEQGKFIVALNYLADGDDTSARFFLGSYPGVGDVDSIVTDETSDTINVALLYGATPNLEIGATYNNQDEDVNASAVYSGTNDPVLDENGDPIVSSTSYDLSNWGLNAKYVFADVFPGTNIGVGGLYQFFDLNDMNVFQLYVAATKVLTEGGDGTPVIRGTLGANYTSFTRTVTVEDEDGDAVDVDVDNNTTRPYVNLDFVFSNKMNVAVEYQLKTSDDFETDSLSSIVLRYPFTENLTGQIGFTNSYRGVAGGDQHNLLAGVSYAFGSASE